MPEIFFEIWNFVTKHGLDLREPGGGGCVVGFETLVGFWLPRLLSPSVEFESDSDLRVARVGIRADYKIPASSF